MHLMYCHRLQYTHVLDSSSTNGLVELFSYMDCEQHIETIEIIRLTVKLTFIYKDDEDDTVHRPKVHIQKLLLFLRSKYTYLSIENSYDIYSVLSKD